MAHLHRANLLTAAGLSTLLDAAERLVGMKPDLAYKAARLCEHACLGANLAIIFPRTLYLRAQLHAMKGEFAIAQGLIERAHDGYEALGMTLEALRTNVGLMRVLGETGRYREALAVGQRALRQMGVAAEQSSLPEPPDYSTVTALLLQNCGFCYEQIGRAPEALAAYAAAETRYRTLGLTEQQAQISENRGAVLMAQGRVQEALQAFIGAQQIYAAAGLDFYHAQTHINIGEAHLLLGNYTASLQAFEAATSLFAAQQDTVDYYILLRHKGDAYLALNLHAEALDAYGQARAGLQATGLTLHYGMTLWGMGMTEIACKQLTAAQQTLTAAAEILHGLDNQPLLSALLLEQSRLLEAMTVGPAPNPQAQALAQQALALVAGSPWAVQKIYACLRLADLALPDQRLAEQWLAAAQRWAATVDLPQLRYRLHQRWGHLRGLQGDVIAAQQHLEQAIDQIEQVRSTLVQERLRASFLDDKSAAYDDLLQLHLQIGTPQSLEAAFGVAERGRSRALADLLAGTIRARLDDPADAELAMQLQTDQAELNALYNRLLSNGADANHRPQAALDANSTIKRAAELEQSISHLRLRWLLQQEEAAGIAPRHALPAVSKPTLPADTALVVYQITGDEVLAFVCIKDEMQVLRRLASVEQLHLLLQRLKAQWATFRNGQPFLDRHQQQLTQAAQHLLHLLYQAVMAPVETFLQQLAPRPVDAVRPLVIVPHQFLHQLPFHALYDGAHYLVERCAISYAPSATVFALCQQRTGRSTGPALTVATPDTQIPAVVLEAQQVAQRLQPLATAVRVLVEEEATLAAVAAAATNCRWLHLACHGLFRTDNPLFSAIQLYDGWLTATQVAQLMLNDAVVTLSACESGRSRMIGGEESIGLVYAFLSAGAATLLVSQWLVQDAITARLMDHWYAQLATTTDLAAALRSAQLHILADHPHPYYWAPFGLIGQRACLSTKPC